MDQFAPATKDVLRSVYASLAATMPTDPSSPKCLAMLGSPGQTVARPGGRFEDIVAGARIVLKAMTQAGRENQQLPLPRTGDALTSYYVRRAAAAARQLPPPVAAKAFLAALGVGLDDSTLLRDALPTGLVWMQIEPATERKERLSVLGLPTMQRRHDSAQHFGVSAALVAIAGPEAARAAGVVKELSDSRQGGSGFSFADLCADMAGVRFAVRVCDGTIGLDTIAADFDVADYMPSMDGLREDMPFAVFVRDFGGPLGDRFDRECRRILERIDALPGYKKK
jgi:hypothetical protein